MTVDRLRRAGALVLGLAIAGSLWFELIPAVARISAYYRHVVKVDPRAIDLGMLALNAALLVAFVALQHLRQSGRLEADQASE